MSANDSWLLFSVCHFTFQYRRIDVIFFKSCNPLKDHPKVKLHQSTVTMALLQKPTRCEMRVPSTLFLFCCCFPPLPCLASVTYSAKMNIALYVHCPFSSKLLSVFLKQFMGIFLLFLGMKITLTSPAIYWTCLLKRYWGSFYFCHWDYKLVIIFPPLDWGGLLDTLASGTGLP